MSHEPYYWLRDFVVRETRTMAFKQLKLLQKKLTHSGFEPERIILTAVVRLTNHIIGSEILWFVRHEPWRLSNSNY